MELFPLGLLFMIAGLSIAIAAPFLSLFLSTEVHATPTQLAAFLVISPLSAVAMSTVVGRLSDRRAMRRALLIVTSVAGCAGSVLMAVFRDYWILLGVTVTAMALAGALFPQAFAYARELLDRSGQLHAAMTISTLRMVFSVAFVAGPPAAAVLLKAGGFAYVYGASAVLYAVSALMALLWLDSLRPATAVPGEPDAAEQKSPLARPAGPSRAYLGLVGAGFVALQCAGVLGVQALALFVTQDLRGDIDDAGLILGLCAAAEIPLILAFGALSTRIPLRRLILLGAAVGVAYYGVASTVDNSLQLSVAQLLNACFIAAVTGLGISFVQELLPREPGRAATLFSNSYPIGAVLAGPLLAVAQQHGYRSAYVICTGLCVAGFALLLVARPRQVEADEIAAPTPAASRT